MFVRINVCFVDHRDKKRLGWYKILQVFFKSLKVEKIINPEKKKIFLSRTKQKFLFVFFFFFLLDNTTNLRTKFLTQCPLQYLSPSKLFNILDFSTLDETHFSVLIIQRKTYSLHRQIILLGTRNSFFHQVLPFLISGLTEPVFIC